MDGCGGASHCFPNDRSNYCPALETVCTNCNTPNHSTNACKQQKTDDQVGVIIAHVHYKNDTYTTMSVVKKVDLIPAKVGPALTKNHLAPTSEDKIFPDSGAGI